MAGKLTIAIFSMGAVCFLAGCSPVQEEALTDKKMSAWASLEEYGLDQMRLLVRLEDANGDVPTGARVYLDDPSNAVSWVYFDSDTNLYTATVSDPVSGVYSVEVESVMGSSSIVIPVTMLDGMPNILTIQDATGVVSGQGALMSAAEAISLAWEPVIGATVYLCGVKKGSATVFEEAVTDTSIVIPEDTLDSGVTYNVTIEAQYIAGDPYLRSDRYYAFNYSESPAYYFTLK